MTDSLSLHDCSSEWNVEQLITLRDLNLDQDDQQLLMRVYTPERFFDGLREYGRSHASMRARTGLMIDAAKNLEDWYETVAPYVRQEQERKEEERKKRFPTPWEKDL